MNIQFDKGSNNHPYRVLIRFFPTDERGYRSRTEAAEAAIALGAL